MAGRRRVARMLWVVAGLFAVSWLPYHAVSLYLNFVSDNDTVSLTVLSVALLLGHSQSAQNPIVYCIMSSTFKHAMTSALRCRRQCHNHNTPLHVQVPHFSVLAVRKNLILVKNYVFAEIYTQLRFTYTKLSSL